MSGAVGWYKSTNTDAAGPEILSASRIARSRLPGARTRRCACRHVCVCVCVCQVRALDAALADTLSQLYRTAHHAAWGAGGGVSYADVEGATVGGDATRLRQGADVGVARLVEGWIVSGLSGYVSMDALLASWDQCFIQVG